MGNMKSQNELIHLHTIFTYYVLQKPCLLKMYFFFHLEKEWTNYI